MKRNFILLIAGSVLLTMSACSSDDTIAQSESGNKNSRIVSKDITINVGSNTLQITKAGDSGKSSRMTVSTNGETVKRQLELGDELRVYSPYVDAETGDGIQKEDTTTLHCVSVEDDGLSGTFTGKINMIEGHTGTQSDLSTYYVVGGGNLNSVKFDKGNSVIDGENTYYRHPTITLTKVYDDFNPEGEVELPSRTKRSDYRPENNKLSQFMREHYIVGLDDQSDAFLPDVKSTNSFYVYGKLDVDKSGNQVGTCRLNSLTAFVGLLIKKEDLNNILYKGTWSGYESTEFIINVNPLTSQEEGFAYQPIIDLSDGTYNSKQYEFKRAGGNGYNALYYYNYGIKDITGSGENEGGESNLYNKFVLTKSELETMTDNNANGILILFPVNPGRYEDLAIYSNSTTPYYGLGNSPDVADKYDSERNEFTNSDTNEGKDFIIFKAGVVTAEDSKANHIFSCNNIYTFVLSKAKWH